MDDLEAAKDYVRKALESFKADPPDSKYQEGYLEALKIVWIEALQMDPIWDQK